MRVNRATVLLALWSVPAGLMVLQMYVSAYINGGPGPPVRAILPAMAEWYVWAPMTPVILRLSSAFPLTRRPIRLAGLPVHLLAIVGCAAVRGIVYASSTFLILRPTFPGGFTPYLWRVSLGWLPIAAVVYGAILAAGAALDFARRLGEREVASAKLGEQLARAELAFIRARLHPHFLFNALHSIGALVRGGERNEAVQMVSDLSELLREVLARDAPDLVRLEDDLSFTRRYLAIESVRFSDRLRVEWDIEVGVERAIIPPLLLQALVENAIRHGIARSWSAGRIAVAARLRGDVLEIDVVDDGPGPSPTPAPNGSGAGFGLDAARARLRLVHGDRADVSLAGGATGGTVARIRLPYQEPTPAGCP